MLKVIVTFLVCWEIALHGLIPPSPSQIPQNLLNEIQQMKIFKSSIFHLCLKIRFINGKFVFLLRAEDSVIAPEPGPRFSNISVKMRTL